EARDEQPGYEPRRDQPRENRNRDERKDDRRREPRRDGDSGAPVVGMGDHLPDFLTRTFRPRTTVGSDE
ncbi:MAG: DEAD/DEAH box helicase, partial [Pseudomonadota bacterium]